MTTIAELKQRLEEFLETDLETTMTITLSHHLGYATYSVRAKEFLESLKDTSRVEDEWSHGDKNE